MAPSMKMVDKMPHVISTSVLIDFNLAEMGLRSLGSMVLPVFMSMEEPLLILI